MSSSPLSNYTFLLTELDSMSSSSSSSSTKLGFIYTDLRTVSKLLLCSVCSQPFVDPVTAEDGQRGCRACLEATSTSVTPITEPIVLEMLNSLLVQCIKCGETSIRRGAFEQHQKESCKRAIVSCAAADIKCPWNGTREQLDEHLSECVFEPLRPALSELFMEIKDYQERIQKLETLVKDLTVQRS